MTEVELFNKAIRVASSCETTEQMRVAVTYCERAFMQLSGAKVSVLIDHLRDCRRNVRRGRPAGFPQFG